MKKLLVGILLGTLFTGVVLGFYCGRKTKPEETSQSKEIAFPDFENSLPVKEEGAPDELKTILLADVRKDDELISRCEDQESFTIEDYEFKSESIDLNDDGIKEFIISPWQICDSLVRGASGNGDIFIFQMANGTWKKIGSIGGNSYAVKKDRTNGYHDIVTNWHSAVDSGTITLHQWQEYRQEFEYLPIIQEFYWE